MKDKLVPWPKKGDQLFKSDVDWWHNACLNFLPDQWNLYAVGYKRAADLLVECVGQTRRHQDTLVYPIVFLYRQYLELRLKELIRNGSLLFDIHRKILRHHKIKELWMQCRKILEKEEFGCSSNDLDAIEECIHHFSEKDPYSMAFRYPTDKNGNRTLPGLTNINLRNIAEVVERIASLLDAASTCISYYLDI